MAAVLLIGHLGDGRGLAAATADFLVDGGLVRRCDGVAVVARDVDDVVGSGECAPSGALGALGNPPGLLGGGDGAGDVGGSGAADFIADNVHDVGGHPLGLLGLRSLGGTHAGHSAGERVADHVHLVGVDTHDALRLHRFDGAGAAADALDGLEERGAGVGSRGLGREAGIDLGCALDLAESFGGLA